MLQKQISAVKLADILDRGSDAPVFICHLDCDKLTIINDIRRQKQQLEFTSNEVWLYPNVIVKLQRKHLGSDKRSSIQVAQAIIDVFVNCHTRVLPSRYHHIQSLDLLKPDGKKSQVVYLGRIGDRISLKSAYLQDASNLNRYVSDGAVQPSMDSANAENAATSIISGTQNKC